MTNDSAPALRDPALLAMRPTTPGISEAVSTLAPEQDAHEPHTLEYFLHATLRSILKLQHESLVRLVAMHVSAHRSSFLQLSIKQQYDFLTNALKKEVSLRMLVIGVIVGHFTEAELVRYTSSSADKAEIHRRIIELAARRVCDAREAVIALL
jgi:hypothetical protein